jgi:Cu/Ag efflux protein CusF
MTRHVAWSALLVLSVTLVGCMGEGSGRSKAGGDKEYDVRGKVVALEPDKAAVTIDHEDIPGLMKGMQMDFQVENPELLKGIKPGDRVQGRLKRSESGYVLTRLEKRPDQ